MALCGSLYRLAKKVNSDAIVTYATRLRRQVGEFLVSPARGPRPVRAKPSCPNAQQPPARQPDREWSSLHLVQGVRCGRTARGEPAGTMRNATHRPDTGSLRSPGPALPIDAAASALVRLACARAVRDYRTRSRSAPFGTRPRTIAGPVLRSRSRLPGNHRRGTHASPHRAWPRSPPPAPDRPPPDRLFEPITGRPPLVLAPGPRVIHLPARPPRPDPHCAPPTRRLPGTAREQDRS